MNEKESKIRSLLGELVENGDMASLDVLFTLALHQTGSSAYTRYIELFERIIGKLAEHNLKLKHRLNVKERKEKINVLNRLHEEYDIHYDDFPLLESILMGDTKYTIVDMEKRIEHLEETEKEVLAFILYYIPLKTEESRNLALESGKEGFEFISGISIRTDDKNNIIYYSLSDFDKLTLLFNKLFNRKLWRSQTIIIIEKRKFFGSNIKMYKELPLWEIGDILVKSGIAYWVPWITGSANVHLALIIPKFLYDTAERYKYLLPEITDLEDEIKEIEESVVTRTRHHYTSEEEQASFVNEKDIEDSIESDPEILEKGLKLLERQKTTDIGIIDILCLDKNNNYVVIELKKDVASDKVVGQIQRYMAWVEENLADKESVRGVIVAQDYDKKLEYAVKGSKYPIEVKIFGDETPVEENVKYCDECGTSNRKSAKFCVGCGNKFWL
jgi:hypothetical protein